MCTKLCTMNRIVVTVIVFLLTTISGQLLGVAKVVTQESDGSNNFEAAFQGKCGASSPCVQLCVELHDGTFECQCRAGYRLLVDGYSCVEITNTTLSDDSSEEAEVEEEEWRQRERQQQFQLLELTHQLEQKGRSKNTILEAKNEEMLLKPPSHSSTTVTRDTTSEYKRSSGNNVMKGKNMAGAAAAASWASKKHVSSSDSVTASSLDDGNGNVRPLPLSLASLSGNKPMAKKPKRPKKMVNTAINAMNKAAEAAFSFGGAPPRPTIIPRKVTYNLVTLEGSRNTGEVQTQKHLLNEHQLGIKQEDEENYEDDYDDDQEVSKEDDEGASSEEEYDDEEEEDEDGDLSLEGEEALRKLKALASGVLTVSDSATEEKASQRGVVEGEVIEKGDAKKELPESSSKAGEAATFKDSYSSSYLNVDVDKEASEFNWVKGSKDKDGREQQVGLQTWLGNGSESTTMSSPVSSSTLITERMEILECPLKCNRGSCTREPSTESGMEQSMTGYRCLCPMGTRGTFCEIDEVAEEGGGYNSGLFRGQSWVAFPVLHDAYMSDQISLEFRPESTSGILLLTGEREDLSGDYLALYIRDGYLEFRFDCGSGSGMVRSATPVVLQQWNRASIVRRRWDGWMQLNDGPFTQGRSKGLFSRITFRQPVFIGGPGNITFSATGSTPTNFDDEPELSPPTPLSSSTTSVATSESNLNNSHSWLSFPQTSAVADELFVASAAIVEDSSSVGSTSTTVTSGSSSHLSEGPTSSSASGVESFINIPISADGVTSIALLLKKTGGFRGCIRNLVINDRAYRFGLEPAGDSLQGFDIESCNDQGVCDLVKCQHGGQCLVQKDDNPTCLCPLGFSGSLCETPLDLQIPSFNGSSYLKYSGLGVTRVLSWLELEIVVKPDAMDGLILYNGYKTDGMGDFIALTIDQGYFEFAMDLGTGTAIVRSRWNSVES